MAHQNLPEYVRDAYQQIKTIHRLVLTVSDDIGDLSMKDKTFESMQDTLCDIECKLQAMRNHLEILSATSK